MLGQYFDILYVVGQCIRGPLINKVKSSNFHKLFLKGSRPKGPKILHIIH